MADSPRVVPSCPTIASITHDANGHDYEGGLLERMFSLATGLIAPTILEIGVRHGNSLRLWAAAAAYNSGFVYGIDATPATEVPFRCTVIGLSSQDVQWERPVDLLYLDGDHSEAGVERDLRQFWPWVKPGGYVLIHDICNEGHWREIFPAVSRFCAVQGLEWSIWSNCCGMALIKKPPE